MEDLVGYNKGLGFYFCSVGSCWRGVVWSDLYFKRSLWVLQRVGGRCTHQNETRRQKKNVIPTAGRARCPFIFSPRNEMWRPWKLFLIMGHYPELIAYCMLTASPVCFQMVSTVGYPTSGRSLPSMRETQILR